MGIKTGIAAVGLVLALSGCCSQMPFMPPKGLLYTHYKAPLSLKADHVKISRPQSEKYVTSFLWIPMAVPPLSVSKPQDDTLSGTYAEYEYFSVFFGIFKRVKVTTYN